MKPRVLIVCNALDDATRLERGIATDSPAGSRKVFLLCQALRLAGARPWVVSLGRGQAGGSMAFFPSRVRRVEGIPVFYAPFSRIPFLSELISLLAPTSVVFRFRQQNSKAVVFYNRLAAYLPVLLLASALGYRNLLDLEDGEVPANDLKRTGVIAQLLPWLYDRLCTGGALLACSALTKLTRVRPVLCYYGTAVGELVSTKWRGSSVSVLMGGTLSTDTGADLLIDTIRQLRRDAPPWAEQLRFEVTGKGPSLEALRALAAETGAPQILIHGRTTDIQYREVLGRCDVGLALKPNVGPLANTTFPSKVIEFSAAGLLVLTTDISDVRQIFGDGARYLTRDDPEVLADLLEGIVKNRVAAQECANHGMRKVRECCSPYLAGRTVANFIFGDLR